MTSRLSRAEIAKGLADWETSMRNAAQSTRYMEKRSSERATGKAGVPAPTSPAGALVARS